MRASFEITASTGKYQVTVGTALVREILENHPSAIVIIDDNLLVCLPTGLENVIPVKATEPNKSIENIAPVIVSMREHKAHRRTHLVAIGGGIVQDIATFVSSIYMRGIAWSYLPTSLLGMVDSCIGGKSSINVAGYKNLVGNFYPPEEVLVDIEFIRSLNTEQVVAGLCEAAKICYAKGRDEFAAYLADGPGHRMDEASIGRIVTRSLQAKRWFIEIDEFDQNERLLLNFGHTFGHALEAATDFGIAHGVAVGLGMMVAASYAETHGLLSEAGHKRCAGLIAHIQALLDHVPSGYLVARGTNLDLVLAKFESDKKHTGDDYRFIAPTKDGALEIMRLPKSQASLQQIAAAYKRAIFSETRGMSGNALSAEQ